MADKYEAIAWGAVGVALALGYFGMLSVIGYKDYDSRKAKIELETAKVQLETARLNSQTNNNTRIKPSLLER